MCDSMFKVLIVENTHSVMLYEEMLFRRIRGCEISTAATGREAVRQHLQEPRDIIIMTDQPVDMEASELYRRLQECSNERPLLFIITTTAEITENQIEKTNIAAGAMTSSVHMRRKPLHLENIKQLIALTESNNERNEHGV